MRTLIILLLTTLTACESAKKITEPKPLEGKNVSVYKLGDGLVELRLKISGVTSTMWMTTELVNNSPEPVTFDSAQLVTFQDTSCLEDKKFEKDHVDTLQPNERHIVRYTFKLHALQKRSTEYERCKTLPLKFAINGVTRAGQLVESKSFTIEP